MTKRLSNSNTLVGLSLEDDSDCPVDSLDALGNACSDNAARPLKGGRSKGRRSSFGGSIGALGRSPPKASEQARIAEMYKTVIKLSSENKINEKNSWSLDLIDHMGKLIKEESSTSRGVNFQKASCTLEASVKIYSHRVDDTHTSSHRILESLSRNGNNFEEEEHAGDNVDEDGNPILTKKIAKVGSKSNSNRLNIAETIERNLSSINAATLDKSQAIDPMFHRLSKAFDEGGVKGLLMANMRVASSSCTLAFECSSAIYSSADATPGNVATTVDDVIPPAEDESHNDCDQSMLDKSVGPIVTKVPFGGVFVNAATPREEEVDDSVVDITDIITKCGFSVEDISSMAICPSLDSYRSALDIKDSSAGFFDPSQFSAYFPSSSRLSLATSVPSAAAVGMNQPPVCAGMIDDDCDLDAPPQAFGDDCDDDDDYSPHDGWNSTPSKAACATPCGTPGRAGTPGTGKRMSFGATKIHWDTVFNANDNAIVDCNENARNSNGAVSLNDGIISHSEYTFFDIDALFKNNAWAGVKHWKLATRSQARMAAQVKVAADAIEGAAQQGNDAVDAEEEAATAHAAAAPTDKKAAKKEKYVIDFAGAYPSEPIYDAPKTKSTTMMTKAAIDKAVNLAGELLLPADAKLQAKDLTRLFLCNQMLLPPPEMQRTLLAATNKNWRFKRNFLGVPSSSLTYAGDMLWGEAEQPAKGTGLGSFAATPAAFDDMLGDDDHDDGGYTYNDDSDDFRTNTQTVLGGTPEEKDGDGLQINANGLLRAARIVDKVDIGYCTIAKRVNVRKLKVDIWSHIDANVKDHANKKAVAKKSGVDADAENVVPENKMDYLSGENDRGAVTKASGEQTEKLSFQELVRDIGTNQNQKEATLPFYFICLLHLANERTLKIDGNMNMDDLVISKDV